ncbi:MAG TPA: adenylate/guanylate cyclase domain-containing protein [Bryobacteraceae bacterium]|nr:adenylate/guanylate cyclase domain-containing protein [Bryobacteraceae bacterium]
MTRKWRHWALCVVLAIGSVLAAWSLDEVSFFQTLNLKAYDAHFVVRNYLFGPPPIPNIVLLTADQKAMDNFPELQDFWNDHYAAAITAAGEAGAKVIGLDVAFGIPIDEYVGGDADERLAGAVSSSPVPVVVGYVERLQSNKAAQTIPINMVAAALGLAAWANLTSDPDGFSRRQELIEAPSPNPDDPPPARCLAMRIVEKYLGADAEIRNGKIALQRRPIPTQNRAVTINYAGGPGTFPRVSLFDFEAAAKAGDKAKLREWVQGKIVLVGSDFVQDRYDTPFFNPLNVKHSDTAGVEIHANTVWTLLRGRYLVNVSQWLRLFSLILATTITVLVSTSTSGSRAAPLIVLEIIAILIYTHLLFESGRILSTSELLLATSICLVFSIVYRFATEEKRGNLFRRAVALFVGSKAATSIDETEAIALSGKRLEVTILFTDIRSFTAFTEDVSNKQGPEAVVQILNQYLAIMVAIIVAYRGHPNKFIGDGILAIFSDDDEGSLPGDHAIRAVQCATEIVTMPGRFETGAGIHTGPAVVGNVGSADKMEYTVLGDTVNLASRLESLNKEHHTKLLMSGATQSKLGNQVETVYLSDAPVRGKALPISLYTVASLVAKAVVNA